MQKECEVCAKTAAKYKCPQCAIKYCSVLCYKQHKETKCMEKNLGPKEPKPDILQNERLQEDKEEGELSDSELEFTEDRVERNVLEKLGESEELRTLLGNPHLRVMMTALADAEDPRQLMEAAMKEPIFTEFADECLKIVEPDQT